jgi:Ca-activated chloride channel family protein
MTFLTPLWLWALLLLPAIPLLSAWAARRDEDRLSRIVARALWPRVVERPQARWRRIRVVLLTLAAAGIFLALARPQWGIVREKVEREGVDVVLVLDTSGSMAVDDVAPNRFFLARQSLLQLIARLEGDRIGLLAFEGEAYPLVPLTLDADAVGLFLETLEPGVVPAAGSSIGAGLAKGVDMFVDKDRRNKVLVLVSDGENLEGEVEGAIRRAKEAEVVVHTVGVGTAQGAPVPEIDREGNRVGYKKDESGAAAISRMNPSTLQAIATGTGGRYFQLTPSDSSLAALASLIEGMEQKSAFREYSYRKKERFQLPLAVALVCLAAALGLPLPPRARKSAAAARKAAAALVLLALVGAASHAHASAADEALLRPKRLTSAGRRAYAQGNHPESLKDFQKANELRPSDPRTRYNVADALYKNGKFDEAEAHFRALGADEKSPVAAQARFNLGDTLFQKKDYPGAVAAYRDSLRLRPGDLETRQNLEMALREIQQQKKNQKQPPPRPTPRPSPTPTPDPKQQQNQKQDQKQDPNQQPRPQPSPSGQGTPRPQPQTQEQKEQQRFQQETGMPKDRAMQLLDALQQNEKQEQKRLMAEQRARKKPSKDW